MYNYCFIHCFCQTRINTGFIHQCIKLFGILGYKRYWKLLELKEQNTITDEQLNELNLLGKDGFYGIYLYCIGEEDECEDIEITNKKELSDYMQNVEVVYRIVKEPDLTYEKL